MTKRELGYKATNFGKKNLSVFIGSLAMSKTPRVK